MVDIDVPTRVSSYNLSTIGLFKKNCTVFKVNDISQISEKKLNNR